MSKSLVKNIFSLKSDIENRYIKTSTELKKAVDICKKMGYKIVLTQGVFDLIHEGHAIFLEKARSYGDVLLVGLDSDELTRQRKGPDRPIVPQQERLNMLVHLRHVDIVTIRELKHDLGHLIRLIRPDVLVVSETTKDFGRKLQMDYKPYCGEIVILPAQAQATTSARIRNLTIEGAEKLGKEISNLIREFLAKIRKP